MKKHLSKLGKGTRMFLIVIIVLISSFILNMILGGFNSSSDIEALQDLQSSLFECENVIYKFETKENEILLYTNKKGGMIECVLDKRNIFSSTTYKNRIAETSAFLDFNGNWNRVNRHFRYYIVEDEDEIEELDFGKYEPIITRIDFTHITADGIEKCDTRWVCVIDEKGDGVLTVS